MPFRNIVDYADFRSEGAWHQASYIRTTAGASAAGRWADMSTGAGQPIYNAFGGSPRTSTPLTNSTNLAVYTGPTPAAGQTKHLHSLTVDLTNAAIPSTFVLCDYLMHYPFVDTDDTSEQIMINNATLPRYTDGDGVQCFIVVQAPMTGANFNGLCTVNYTNSANVSGRTTTFALLGSPTIGSLVNAGNDSIAASVTQASPFIPLQGNDAGIRSIQSITLDTSLGGLCSFVLCYPIANIPLLTNLTQTEKTFFSRTGRAPQIYDGSFLHFLINNTTTTVPITFRSSLTFVWG